MQLPYCSHTHQKVICGFSYWLLRCCFTETVERNDDKAKLKKEIALIQDEQRKLVKNMDELKDQVESQSTDLRSQIVAAQS